MGESGRIKAVHVCKREEQRRFEILDAHWDVPLSPVEPPR